MNPVTTYTFSSSATIRIVLGMDGEPWFVAADVCAVLEIGNVSMAVSRLDADEVTLSQIEGSHRPTNIISESGLYSLVLRSDKPAAKQFKKWVTGEVLPSIRKTGAYGIPKTFSAALQLAADQQRVIEQQAEQIERDAPKVDFHDRVAVARDAHPLEEAAKLLRTGRNRLAAWLREQGYLTRCNLPYQQFLDSGLFRAVETPYTDAAGCQRLSAKTLVTGKGLAVLSLRLDREFQLASESAPPGKAKGRFPTNRPSTLS